MAVHALVVGLVKRRALLRACVAAVTAAMFVGAFAFCAGVAVLGANAATPSAACSLASSSAPPTMGVRIRQERLATFTARQMAVARDYVSIGRQLGVPRAGQIIAIMMALQESSLRVLANVNVPASLSYPHDDEGSRATLNGVEQILDRDAARDGGERIRLNSVSREGRFEKIINESLIARGSSDRAHVVRIDKRNYVVYSAHRIPDEIKAAVEEINTQIPYWINFSYMLTYSEDGPDA